MSRSGYNDDNCGWEWIMWRGAVKSAINGKRGQSFLKEALEALDALPEKELIKGDLITPQGEVCLVGSVMKKRGIDTAGIDIEDADHIANKCGVSTALIREIEFINDEAWDWGKGITDERRYELVRAWVIENIKEEKAA